MFSQIKRLLGEDAKKLISPIILLTLDSVFNVFFYAMLYFVLLDLIQESLSIQKIQKYILMMIVAFVLRLLAAKKGCIGIQISGATATKKMRISLADHLRKLNLGYFDKNSIGSLTNIMTNDLTDFEKVITHVTGDLIKIILSSIYLLAITFVIDSQLAIYQLLIILVALPIIIYGGHKVEKTGNYKKIVMSSVISRIIEYINGIQLFKSYNLVGEKFERLEKSFRDLKKESIRTELSIVPYILIFQILVDLSFPILLLISTNKFMLNQIDKIQFLTFIIINLAFTNVFRGFSAQYGMMRYLRLSCKKLISVYDHPIMSYDEENVNFSNFDINFSDVSFEYEKNQQTLKNINFKAKEGTMTALIGPSGSGKTTITSLIARFWDVNSGSIKIGEKDIKKLNPENLLENISIVFQDVYLLKDTIINNIKLGRPEASREDIIKAAKLANCDEFINKLENGYDTIIAEEGNTLSGGEKQRISIARAILKNAPIVLLDEATASLDADNEFEIRKSIKKLTKNKTVIVIAHRLNTIQDANQIIVLNNGEIEEIGSHIDLMKNKKRYYTMYLEMQRAKNWAI